MSCKINVKCSDHLVYSLGAAGAAVKNSHVNQMMTKVFKTKKRAEDLSEMEWRDLAKNASGNVDMKAIFNEAKSVQKKAKNNDEYGDYKDVKPFEDK